VFPTEVRDMAYEGELMTSCPAKMFNFGKTYAVIVSGAKWNPYGHMLLNTGGPGGIYVQVVTELRGQPRMMNEAQFQRYLREQNKTIVSVLPVHIPNPSKSQLKLEEILSQQWTWGAVVHNCESLVEEILAAGGGPTLHHGYFPLPMKSTNQCSPW
jgi:hypothetical protein